MATKHVVGFSGGIDSQACAGYVLERENPDDVILINSDAGGNEHPMTTQHCEWYSANVHPVVMIQAKVSDLGEVGTRCGATGDRRRSLGEDSPLTFDRLAFVKGIFPSRKAQFCTEYLKLSPHKRWIEENLADVEIIRYAGVRRDESNSRADAKAEEWDDYYDCLLRRPLVEWTKKECFDFCKKRGEQINQLYLMGFSRVGCAPCINSGKDDIREWAARFPEMIDKVRVWEKSVGRTFFRPMIPKPPAYKKAFKAWQATYTVEVHEIDDEGEFVMRREVVPGSPAPPEVPLNWIDDCVAWAKTAHGGQRITLGFVEADAASGTCVSKYGLCE